MLDQFLLSPAKLVTSVTLVDKVLGHPRHPRHWTQDVTACVTISTESATVL